jgi:hypothetical protein
MFDLLKLVTGNLEKNQDVKSEAKRHRRLQGIYHGYYG